MNDETEEIGDIEPDDTFDDDDDTVDWSQVERLQGQVDGITAIDDEEVRTFAARGWASALAGES